MQTPEQSDSSDEFDQVLADLARPPAVGAGVVGQLGARSTHPLEPALEQVVRAAAGIPCEPQPGDVLEGRYRISALLGRGGMGVVLEAEQLRTGKTVAIKWMNGATSAERSASSVARFQREARAVANIHHPNVVLLHDVGDSGGVPYLVLERLRGESLRARLVRGVLSWAEAEPILRGILRGVAAVHAAGIVHRDLKPDNIFLSTDEAGALTVKVLDFGVAAMRSSTQDGLHSLTRTGALLGTPAYMALEQLTGGDVDTRADIYALGAMLYEMLAGQLPFEARSAPELAVLLATKTPILPSRLKAQITPQLEQTILRALAREPAQRFPEVSAFAAALDAAQQPVRPARAWRVAVLAAAAIAAAMAWGASGRAPSQPGAARHIVATAQNRASAEAAHKSSAAAMGAPPAATTLPSSATPAAPPLLVAPKPVRVASERQLRTRKPEVPRVVSNAREDIAGTSEDEEARDVTKIGVDDF